ncbi:MAG: flagellar motor stator protein MotA, partial [Pseudomonas sp.]|uniref:flagellar motor stator protein MotA n=1 Tax=Pseudomonas sp. TaxID=306 RepID=UPI00120AEC7B
MFVIIGYLVAIGCIFGGYIIHGGNIGVVLHALPIELMVIGGGAIGAFVVNNQPKVLKSTLKLLPSAFKGSKYTKARYLELMALLYDILQKARKDGLMSIEKDVETPQDSPIFQKYPKLASDHHVVEFTTDYLRMMVSGNLNAHEIEALMESEIDTHHSEAHAPVAAIARLAGGLPAFGIVAAVLGVVNTMGSVGQPPAVLGGMIGSALVGTFLGILLAYGIVEPLGGLLEQKVEDGSKELQCI